MERVELPRTLAIQILQNAQSTPDREVCGLVAANGEAVLRVIRIRNAASAPGTFFEMDERELIDAMKAMRERGESLFAIYHSHPQTAPVPSPTDIQRTGYPDALHLIVSMETKGVLQMRGWRLKDDACEPVDVGVREEN